MSLNGFVEIFFSDKYDNQTLKEMMHEALDEHHKKG